MPPRAAERILVMMKSILVLSIAGLLTAQETRREIVNAAPTAEGDSKPNSDKAPDVYAIKGQFDRILVLRFKYNGFFTRACIAE